MKFEQRSTVILLIDFGWSNTCGALRLCALVECVNWNGEACCCCRCCCCCINDDSTNWNWLRSMAVRVRERKRQGNGAEVWAQGNYGILLSLERGLVCAWVNKWLIGKFPRALTRQNLKEQSAIHIHNTCTLLPFNSNIKSKCACKKWYSIIFV